MTEEELEKRYQSLPPELKEALSDKKLSEKVDLIGKEFKISEEAIEELAAISGEVFLGILPLSNLAKELKEKLNISENESQALAEKLNSEIFYKYKDQLSSLQKFPSSSQIKEEGPIKTSEDKKVIEEREELLRKKRENDPYREPIDDEEETESPFTIKEEGRIKKIL